MSTRSCRPLADNGPGPPHRSRIKPSRPRRLQRSKQLTSAGRAVVCTYRRLHPARGRVWLKKVSARSTARRLSPHRFRYLVCSNRHHRRRCVCIYITVTRPTCTQREKKKKKERKNLGGIIIHHPPAFAARRLWRASCCLISMHAAHSAEKT